MKVRSQKPEARSQKVCAKLWLVFLVGWAINALGQEKSPKLQPPLGEIPPTFWELHGTTVLVSVPVAMLLFALGIWLWLRPKQVAATPPEVQARTALEALLKQPEDGAVVSRASQVLRHYVLAVFELPPGEPTTSEFSRLVSSHDKIGPEFAAALAGFLRQCDERKFALASFSTPLGAATRALELLAQGEARRAELKQRASNRSAVAST